MYNLIYNLIYNVWFTGREVYRVPKRKNRKNRKTRSAILKQNGHFAEARG